MNQPTAKQKAVMDFIVKFQREHHGMSPCLREIANHFGVNLQAINGHLRLLSRKRLIERTPRIARSLRVLVPVS